MVSRREALLQESGSYTPKLVACFYAVFDPVLDTLKDDPTQSTLSPPPHERGRDADPSPAAEPIPRSNPVLFDFASIIDFVIPKPELCGHLITKATRTSKILGFPVRIVDEEKYHGSKAVYNRNAFIFNVCFVFERDAELSVYEPVARKTGRTLCAMEEQFSLLSSPPPSFSMANLLEQLYLDLNAYFETSIPLIDTELDLCLYPFYANPPPVRIWDVPVAVTDLEQMKSRSWDVTLYKVCSFINGVNHVKRIAELAEVDLFLARQCIQHLVYYNAVIIVDLFQFSNSYAVLPDIADAAQYGEDDDEGGIDLRTECENYVHSGARDTTPVPFSTLLSYYSKLRPGLSVSGWMDQLSLDSEPIDVRRMIQFGVIKGFLRRVHAYPVWLDHPALQPRGTPSSGGSRSRSGSATVDGSAAGRARRRSSAKKDRSARPALSSIKRRLEPSLDAAEPVDAPAPPRLSTLHPPAPASPADALTPAEAAAQSGAASPALSPDEARDGGGISYPPSLALLFDGAHHADEICLRYGIAWRTLEAVLRDLGGGGASGLEKEDGEEDEEQDEEKVERARRRRGSRSGENWREAGPYGEKVVMLWV
ncbi:hypothetical protein Rhopal_001327-T1 [Rhodotorula paludigena]|uniref:Nitrogen permease regulator Npr2 n=1 Tax=Rhodotorula paludigena TaxID=86838 RepID=A0AAV5GGA5_9BASI|nr:hypothetical protein Rhopal_001327-T1 [Rhodotorula paludigena]